ncbi:MAG: 6-carboxytetrahydropterin synthase [Gemmatimonadaceae bacterium]
MPATARPLIAPAFRAVASALLTRRVTFSAAHRYRRPDWSDERNAATFGAAANPHFHGHSYTCDVTVRGDIDETTGMIVDLGRLDEVLRREVRERFDGRNINAEVHEFRDGALVPTGENLARFIFDRVQRSLSGSAEVTSVIVREDETLGAEYRGGGTA